MSDKKFVLIYYLWMVFRKSPPVNSPPVNPPPPSRVRLGVGQFTGRQFDRGEFTGGGAIDQGGSFLVHFGHRAGEKGVHQNINEALTRLWMILSISKT